MSGAHAMPRGRRSGGRPAQLWVLYDDACGFCCRCRDWLEGEPQRVPLRFLPSSAAESCRRFPGLETLAREDELVVVSDRGAVYKGAKAWVVCLWALRGYRRWAKRLASPLLRPLARRLYAGLSRGRHGLSDALGLLADHQLRDVLEAEAAACAEGGCQLQRGRPEPGPEGTAPARGPQG